MIIHEEMGYRFILKSNGVIVLRRNEYRGFYPTLEKALDAIFGLA